MLNRRSFIKHAGSIAATSSLGIHRALSADSHDSTKTLSSLHEDILTCINTLADGEKIDIAYESAALSMK